MNCAHETVLDAFRDTLSLCPQATALRLVETVNNVDELAYETLYRLASDAAAGFRAHGIRRGDRVILALPTSREFFAAYLGALFSGIIPLTVPTLRGGDDGAPVVKRLDELVRQIEAALVVVPSSANGVSAWNMSWRPLPAGALLTHGSEPLEQRIGADDVAHLQLTSGSTGQQRVAIVRHGNIVANVAGIGGRIDLRPDDQLFIWLPLFHDMGLVAVACTFYWQRPMTLTDPINFVRNPIRYWWQLMSRYRATITAAPNSSYQACARLAARRRFPDIDLSCCRLAFWGAEPIHSETLDAFCAAFEPYGYRREMTLPVYGLAEATLAATVPEVDRPPLLDAVSSSVIETLQLPSAPPMIPNRGSRTLKLVGLGHPLPGHRIRLTSGEHEIIEDRRIGEVEVAGPSIVDGYWGDRTGLPRHGDYLATGDLGYMCNGQLVIVGRRKEIIIVGGRNFIPAEIEELADRVVDSGIHKGVAAIGMHDPVLRTDCVHLLIESRVRPPPGQEELEERVRESLAETLGLTGVIIQWLPKGAIPKTTSGKIQRYRCLELATGMQQGGTQ